jgi:hypothetical protein
MSGSLTVPPGGELYEKEVVDIRSVLHSYTPTTEDEVYGWQRMHF